MPYCYDCSGIYGYEGPDSEIESVNLEEGTVHIEVRMYLTCANGGEEKKTTTFELEEALEIPEACCDKPDWSVDESEINVETGERYQDKSRDKRTGVIRKINNTRYMKKFYTIEVSGDAKCDNCDETVGFSLSDEVQASAMEEV